MSMIQVEGLTFAYPSGSENIFENVTFRIDTDWKLGFVGRNGRGKTTFLKLLCGQYEYRGKISASVRFDYFPYPVREKERPTAEILREACPEAEDWQFLRELSALGMEADIFYRPFDTLSGGEQTKALLAALFLNEGHFLLIDEPTNHLDAESRKAVARYLQRKKGFILVSHDRRFLDGCVDHILALNRAEITVENGNFSSYMERFEKRQEGEKAQNERAERDIRRLKQAAERTAQWADMVEASKIGAGDKGYVGHKAAKMMKRAKVTEARKQQAVEQKSALLKNLETAEDLKIFPLEYFSETLLSVTDLEIDYGAGAVCSGVSFSVKRGERVFLDGRNGSGKSSILKLIAGEAAAYRGTVRIGSRLIVSYVPQDTSFLRGSLAEFAGEHGLNEPLFKAVLNKMDFEKKQFETDMREFSGGQKKKALIAKSLCESAHLYVWDEPLNFIDVYSRMQIERLIEEFAPTMLLVEHDGAFREKLASKIVSLF